MHKTIFGAILANLTFLALLSTGAFAQPNDSVYTKINLDEDCSLIEAHEMGATFGCPGYKGYPVMVAEGDLRMFVSYGLDSMNEVAAGQTIPAFNTVHDTLEWRLANKEFGWTPIATILRYFTDDGMGDKQQILVVTKVKLGETCQVARVNASKYKNANQIARDLADSVAETFDCANQPIEWGQ